MLTEKEREAVRRAVAAAEKGLGAEIVPCVFAQSSHYPEAVWAAGAAGAALACAALLLVDSFQPLWTPLSHQLLVIPTAGLLGAALGRWCSRTRRFFVGARQMERVVARRAKEVFFDRGVSKTKARDGVLLYLSLLERKAVILADEGVRAKVAADRWRPALEAVTRAAAEGRVADGLAAAVAKIAEVLRAAGFSGAASLNELGDNPIEGGG